MFRLLVASLFLTYLSSYSAEYGSIRFELPEGSVGKCAQGCYVMNGGEVFYSKDDIPSEYDKYAPRCFLKTLPSRYTAGPILLTSQDSRGLFGGTINSGTYCGNPGIINWLIGTHSYERVYTSFNGGYVDQLLCQKNGRGTRDKITGHDIRRIFGRKANINANSFRGNIDPRAARCSEDRDPGRVLPNRFYIQRRRGAPVVQEF